MLVKLKNIYYLNNQYLIIIQQFIIQLKTLKLISKSMLLLSDIFTLSLLIYCKIHNHIILISLNSIILITNFKTQELH